MSEHSAEMLLRGWTFQPKYFAVVILLSLLIRLLMASLRAFERPVESGYANTVRAIFLGKSVKTQKGEIALVADYWHPFILGTFELITYPVLMVTGAWTMVGAWLAFKTLPHWKDWTDKRVSFNRFLIGNALVLLAGYYFLVPLVSTNASVDPVQGREVTSDVPVLSTHP